MAIYKVTEFPINETDKNKKIFVSSQEPLTEEEKNCFLSTLCRVKDTYKKEYWDTTELVDMAITRFNAIVSHQSHILHFHTNPIEGVFIF